MAEDQLMSSAAACDLEEDIWSQQFCSPQPSVVSDVPTFDEFTAAKNSSAFKRWTLVNRQRNEDGRAVVSFIPSDPPPIPVCLATAATH